MFQLRFSPTFRKQREALLSEMKVPEITLTAPLKSALEEMVNDSSTRGPVSAFQLWILCFRVCRPLLIKAGWIASLASLAAAGATFVAMEVLKNKEDLNLLLAFSVAYFAMNALAIFASFLNNRIRFWIGLTAETTLVSALSKKLLRLNAESASRQTSGNLKVLITSDVKSVSEFLNNFVRNLIPSVVALIFITPLLIHFSGTAGIIGVITLMMLLPISFGLNLISTRLQYKIQDRMDLLTSITGEWVKNIRLVRFLSWEDALQEKITSQLRRFMGVAVLQHLMACVIFGLSTTWWMITATSILIFANVFHYPLDLSGFFGSLWLLTFIAGYFTHIPNTIRLFGLAAPSMNRIAKLLSEGEQADSFLPESGPLDDSARPTRVIFDRVSFHSAVNELTFEIDLSTQLAVLGEVGSGKSTLLKLLCGEVPPTSGSIHIEFSNGTRRNLWEEPTYRRFRDQLAFVPQQPYVSSDLLSTNIALSEAIEEADILNAAHMAELSADLKHLPMGILQPIGESGVNLSGGQRQRLNLARAFHSHRPYLVLDDTLSAVDAKTEMALMKQLVENHPGFVLVTHRLNEIMRVAQVMVLKNGKLVEQGSPTSLANDPNSAFTRALQAYSTSEDSIDV